VRYCLGKDAVLFSPWVIRIFSIELNDPDDFILDPEGDNQVIWCVNREYRGRLI
jgi:hypothetical protein